jgi:hypothetical protein
VYRGEAHFFDPWPLLAPQLIEFARGQLRG